MNKSERMQDDLPTIRRCVVRFRDRNRADPAHPYRGDYPALECSSAYWLPGVGLFSVLGLDELTASELAPNHDWVRWVGNPDVEAIDRTDSFEAANQIQALKSGYDALDRNWQAQLNAVTRSIADALGISGDSRGAIVEAVERLQSDLTCRDNAVAEFGAKLLEATMDLATAPPSTLPEASSSSGIRRL